MVLYQPALVHDVPGGGSGSIYELHPRTILAMLALALIPRAAEAATTTTILILEDGETLIHRVSVWGVVAAATAAIITVHNN